MIRRLSLLLVASTALALAWPGLALANSQITITFDGGTFDPNPPPGIDGTPDVYEAGAIFAGFWWENAGSPAYYDNIGHTHVEPNTQSGSLVAVPHSWRDAMQGGVISMEDGSPFRVVSIDYRIERRDPAPNQAYQFQRLPWTYALDDVQLLLSENPNPGTADFASFQSQWNSFAIDDGSVLDLGGGQTDPLQPAASTPWQTLYVTGFENVTQVHIGHTGMSVAIDNIVLELVGGGGIPEPGTAVLLGTGLGLLAARQRRLRRAA